MFSLKSRCGVWLLLSLSMASLLAKESPLPVEPASVEWLEPGTTLDQLTRTALQESNIVSDFASMVARDFEIGSRLTIVVGGDGQPDYRPDSQTLSLPYAYLAAVVRAQSELVEDRQEALARGMDMVEYTLYHLFGHVLAGDLSADADDAAEAISTWLMLTRWPNGGEQWFAGVQAFGKASQALDGPLSDYWHGHSLYKSRQKRLECAILGSDPDRYERLFKAVLEPQKRRAECVAYWQEVDASVQKQLLPRMLDR